jgi:hypothetical protein
MAMSDCGPDAMPIVPTPTSRDLPGGPRSGSALSVRVLAPILVATACTGPPCQIDRLDDLPAAAPGQVRHGLALAQGAGLSATAGGVACLTCDGIFYFDPALSEQRHVAIDLAGAGQLATGGDTTFVFDRDPGRGAEASGGVAQPAHDQLAALSAAGRELWRDDFGAGEAWQGVVGPELLAGPGGVVVRGAAIASVFDPATGAARWTAALAPGDVLALDPAGGLVIASGDSQLGPASPEATLRHLDAGGAMTWTVSWATRNTPPAVGGDVAFTAAAPTAGGGVVVAGRFTTTALAIGDLELAALPLHGSIDGTRFVAALDASGAARWGVAIGTSDAAGRIDARRIAALGDAAVICGDHAGAGQLGLPATDATTDAFVARIDPTGAITAHAITGDGDQTCEALAVAADGSATLAVHSARGPGGSELRVGSQIFDDGPEQTFYVLNLVP